MSQKPDFAESIVNLVGAMKPVQHTPGPWHTKRAFSCTSVETKTGSRVVSLSDHHEYQGEPCGSIESLDKTQAEIEANAALIAAAPALLEACELLVSKFDGLDHKEICAPIFNIIENQIKEAIAKAQA